MMLPQATVSMLPHRVAGSFRDPSGHVFESGGHIYRTVEQSGSSDFAASEPIMRRLVDEGRLVRFEDAEPEAWRFLTPPPDRVLRHPKIETLTLPYEWPFELLKDAALFHLRLHQDLLKQGFTLSDASAYNIQFVGPQPIFIDHLSIKPYLEGAYWLGHKQFCEQFLIPLLLRSRFDVTHHSWYRGSLEGIPLIDFVRLLPMRSWLSLQMAMHVLLPAKLQSRITSSSMVSGGIGKRRLPKTAFISMLRGLEKWIASLHPRRQRRSVWATYASHNTYARLEAGQKQNYVAEFVRSHLPEKLIDLGCNTGDFAVTALASGAKQVIGFDYDPQALDAACERAKRDTLCFLPLYLDARNPPPSQGWLQRERMGFNRRFSADAIIALAFEHHLAIAHNIPLEEVIEWIVGMAPKGIIEFVPKNDETIQRMLANRDDIFSDYDANRFERALQKHVDIQKSLTLTESGRTLYTFQKK